MRSEARRGHEDQSMHEARSAECIDVSKWPLSASDLTMHDTSCLNPIITWIICFWYIWKPKFTGEVPKREVENHALWKIYAWFCRSRALQRLRDVIMIPVSLNLHKIWTQILINWKSFGLVRFVNCASIDFDEIYVNSNKNSGSIL